MADLPHRHCDERLLLPCDFGAAAHVLLQIQNCGRHNAFVPLIVQKRVEVEKNQVSERWSAVLSLAAGCTTETLHAFRKEGLRLFKTFPRFAD